MAEVVLTYDVFIDAIAEEADRFSHVVAGHFDEQVPTCPEWVVGDLVDHMVNVYRRWTVQLMAENPGEQTPHEKLAGGDESERMERFDKSLTAFIKALEDRPSDAPCWNYVDDDLVANWVARRIAHESAIHRIDAEIVIGAPSSIDRELAADGLNERLTVILPARVAALNEGSLGGSLCIVCDDTEMSFVVEAEAPKWRYRMQRGPADCVVVGSADDLFRFSWNRPTRNELELTGDSDVYAAWGTLPG